MVMARRVAPFVYVAIALIASLVFRESVADWFWILGAIALGAFYVTGLGRNRIGRNRDREAERSLKRNR